jgi:ABC-2 type transport system permease protein
MRIFSARLRAQIVKELLSLLRDPRARVILILPPLLQLVVFSFAVTLEVRNVEVAVHDRDGGRASHELVARIASASFVGGTVTVRSSEAAQRLIDRGKVMLALDIPETFSRDVAAGRPARAQAIFDGRRANAAQVTLGYLNALAAALGAELDAGGPQPTAAAVRHWFNPNLTYQWFVVPSLGGILVTLVTLITTALSIARERELGTFDQLLVSPCTTAEIIVSKMAPAFIIGVALGAVMAGAAVFAFGIPFTGSPGLLLAALLLYILSVVGIGLMISAVCATQQQAILGTFAIAVPTTLMSGFATPIANMPEPLQWIAQAIPLTHYLIILQGSFLKELPLSVFLSQAWPMAAVAAVTLPLAAVFVRARLQ